jgi:hypothetical protein
MDISVKAYPTSAKSHEAGIFANIEIQIKDGNNVLFSLRDANLRRSKDGKGWWIAEPSRKVTTSAGEKYYRYWWFSPGDPNDQASRDRRNQAEQWLVGEVLKQIPDPTIPSDGGRSTGQASTPPPTKARAPFAATTSGAPAANRPSRSGSPFGGMVPSGDDFALGGSAT